MADNVIKAIETVYNGYRFRSRLEARWAVFFDCAYIKYEYEPEGYKLRDGSYYLPDFYLPDVRFRGGRGVFVEVKGSLNGERSYKPNLFCNPLYVVTNIPFDTNETIETAFKYMEQESELYPYSFVHLDGDTYPASFCSLPNRMVFLLGPDHDGPEEGYAFIDEQYKKARQARFEHGERGTEKG